ncbi:hypothetical protein NQ315_017157 [Exocentrus adspersus]|uniref:DNA/RNA non-specific endonuclease/pyrophosphatase/phosphodiesterase domain-containing protein n=1 Tax=Exocentrus adspersus TaxID=1586481 RepID=A0AAV8VGZ4_9CUCU|nr:hypothetical protein NQ315_017157 [Exocentrus adspersus]
MWFLLLSVSVLSSVASAATTAGCVISTNGDLGEPQPLIVDLSLNIIEPQGKDEVAFSANETFLLSCPNSHLIVESGNTKRNLTENETATCVSGKQFRVQNTTTIFANITCLQYPYHVARLTNQTCEHGNQEIEVGFFILQTYVRHVSICFDKKQHASLYSYFRLTPTIQGRQSGFPRPSWINGNFYSFGSNSSNTDANSLLILANQIATISKLIGYNSTTSNPYVNNTADLYLARGHLTAKADFVYGSQQRLTFHMVNAMPQWQTFNGINWAYLEADVRNLAINYNLTLQVYTGTYGVMSLPHVVTNQSVKIYLYNDNSGNQEFPVPLLYWKFVYEPVQQAGIVLVGVNNPYIVNVSDAIICTDVYDTINWTTTFSRNDILNGYMYGCDPDELRKTITYIPKVTVKSLLVFNSSYNGTRPSSAEDLRSISFTVSILCIFLISSVNIMS